MGPGSIQSPSPAALCLAHTTLALFQNFLLLPKPADLSFLFLVMLRGRPESDTEARRLQHPPGPAAYAGPAVPPSPVHPEGSTYLSSLSLSL